MKNEIIEFAEKYIRFIRDETISECLSQLRNNTSPCSKRWKKSLQTGDINDIGQELIPDIVDNALAGVLDAIDNGRIKLKYISDSNVEVDLCQEGLCEMTGYYMSSNNGWRQNFSNQRINDDFSDLNLDFLSE